MTEQNEPSTPPNSHLAPDEQSTPETETEVVRPVRISLRLFTDGKHPAIDRLGLLMEVLGQMPDNERRASLAYAVDFYKRRDPK